MCSRLYDAHGLLFFVWGCSLTGATILHFFVQAIPCRYLFGCRTARVCPACRRVFSFSRNELLPFSNTDWYGIHDVVTDFVSHIVSLFFLLHVHSFLVFVSIFFLKFSLALLIRIFLICPLYYSFGCIRPCLFLSVVQIFFISLDRVAESDRSSHRDLCETQGSDECDFVVSFELLQHRARLSTRCSALLRLILTEIGASPSFWMSLASSLFSSNSIWDFFNAWGSIVRILSEPTDSHVRTLQIQRGEFLSSFFSSLLHRRVSQSYPPFFFILPSFFFCFFPFFPRCY